MQKNIFIFFKKCIIKIRIQGEVVIIFRLFLSMLVKVNVVFLHQKQHLFGVMSCVRK